MGREYPGQRMRCRTIVALAVCAGCQSEPEPIDPLDRERVRLLGLGSSVTVGDNEVPGDVPVVDVL